MLYTCRDWCVGSVLDETCSEMWYALWTVRFRESIDTWTHTVMFGHSRHMYVSVLIVFDHKYHTNIAVCVSLWCRTNTDRYWHICLWVFQYMQNQSVASAWFQNDCKSRNAANEQELYRSSNRLQFALNCCIHMYCQFACGCNLLATPIQWGWQPRMEPAHIYLRLTQHE